MYMYMYSVYVYLKESWLFVGKQIKKLCCFVRLKKLMYK